jgi:hypothetical protein
MVDLRKPGTERGLTAACKAELLSGDRSKPLNRRIHSRYLSAAAMADPGIEPVFASFDDVTIRLTPNPRLSGIWPRSTQAFGGRLGGTPGYLLPLD